MPRELFLDENDAFRNLREDLDQAEEYSDPGTYVGECLLTRRCIGLATKEFVPGDGLRMPKGPMDLVRMHNARGDGLGTLTAEEWEAIQRHAGGKCIYCERRLRGRVILEHVLPIRRGGRTEARNVVASCLRCNVSKKSKTPEEWLSLERYEAFTARLRSLHEAMGLSREREREGPT